jgi:hypothetical protein
MDRKTDNELLLADVLGGDAEYRDALLGETLRLARRRRQTRQTRRAALIAAMIGMAALLMWRSSLNHPNASRPAVAAYELVHTQPLPASSIVASRPLPADRLIASVSTVQVVPTAANAGEFREINDDELMALAAPRPAALVRTGPHSARLIFVDQQDQESTQ